MLHNTTKLFYLMCISYVVKAVNSIICPYYPSPDILVNISCVNSDCCNYAATNENEVCCRYLGDYATSAIVIFVGLLLGCCTIFGITGFVLSCCRYVRLARTSEQSTNRVAPIATAAAATTVDLPPSYQAISTVSSKPQTSSNLKLDNEKDRISTPPPPYRIYIAPINE